jgi:membrane-associated phospholipid phosphatase
MRVLGRSFPPLVLATFLLAAPPGVARAEGEAVEEPRPTLRPLQNTGAAFLGMESASAIAIFATYSIAAGYPPESCTWCNPPGFDESLRDALVLGKGSRKSAATVSHVLSAGVIPAAAFTALLVPALSQGKGSYALQDVWIIINTVVLTAGVADGTKKLVARQRPAFHYGEEHDSEWGGYPSEQHLSFFSGDTSWAFSFAASASTLAFLRGNRLAPFIAAGGGALALGTGFLRIAADTHWTTDVLAGAVVGTGLGVAVPLLLHRPIECASALRISPWIGRTTGLEVALAL